MATPPAFDLAATLWSQVWPVPFAAGWLVLLIFAPRHRDPHHRTTALLVSAYLMASALLTYLAIDPAGYASDTEYDLAWVPFIALDSLALWVFVRRRAPWLLLAALAGIIAYQLVRMWVEPRSPLENFLAATYQPWTLGTYLLVVVLSVSPWGPSRSCTTA